MWQARADRRRARSSRRSTSRSTSWRTRSRRRSPRAARSCSSPRSRTPIGALIIGEVLAETDLPARRVLDPARAPRGRATCSSRTSASKLLTFTGSPAVGWDLKARAGTQEGGARARRQRRLHRRRRPGATARRRRRAPRLRRVLPVAARAASACSASSRTRPSTTSCARSSTAAVARAAHGRSAATRTTFIGPMIAEAAAKRVERLDRSGARRAARKRLCGGKRKGTMLRGDAARRTCRTTADLYRKEAFGPVAVLRAVRRLRRRARRRSTTATSACRPASSPRDLAQGACAPGTSSRSAASIVGDVPSFRVDNMPYGGVKDSGLGREGVRYAIEDMTETAPAGDPGPNGLRRALAPARSRRARMPDPVGVTWRRWAFAPRVPIGES